MKLTLAKLKQIVPVYMAATPTEKPKILEQHGIARSSLYAAMKRYNLTIVKTLA
ncbi:hypothetical protein D3C75_185460 [compost metagenome]